MAADTTKPDSDTSKVAAPKPGVLTLPPAKNIHAEFVTAEMGRIRSVANPSIDFDRFIASCVIALNQVNAPTARPETSLVATFNAATIGLVPNLNGQCFFIPRSPRRGDPPRVNLEIGYRGYLELGYRAKYLRTIHADVVFNGDEFDYWTDESGARLTHRPNIHRDLTDARKHVTHAYCVYSTIAGGKGLCVVPRKQLDAVDSNSNVWVSDYYSMARKTAIRRAAKDWRLVGDLATAMEIEEYLDQPGAHQHMAAAIAHHMRELAPRLSFEQFGDQAEADPGDGSVINPSPRTTQW